jgi:low temperature requirement protein LtrA
VPNPLARLKLRSTADAASARRVTWLELFFDLIFVAAVAQVAEPLREHYAPAEVARFAALFVLIWWAWTGNSVFATRFDTDDVVQRGLTLVQMFAVAAMAANATDALDSRSSAGFAAAYAAVRLVLVAQYARARHLPDARGLATRYLTGHGAAALIWLLSALVPTPARFWLWGLAFAIDLGTPWLAVRHSVKLPPNPAHLPERFGLFTLILLGDAVVAVMQGMESQETWRPAAAASAFLGMALLFVVWWWYFDGAAGADEQPVRSRREAVRFHVWSYAHFPLYLGVAVAGVGIKRIVTEVTRASLDPVEVLILTGSVALAMLSMTAVGNAAAHRRHHPSSIGWIPHLGLALLTSALGPLGMASPLPLIVTLTALCAAQLWLSLSAPLALHASPVARLSGN